MNQKIHITEVKGTTVNLDGVQGLGIQMKRARRGVSQEFLRWLGDTTASEAQAHS
jgi:hypothetical protein